MGSKNVIKSNPETWQKHEQDTAQKAAIMCLLFALRSHDVACTRYAISVLHADVNRKISDGSPQMHSAIRFLRPEIRGDVESVLANLKLLIDAGADVNMRDCCGETALCVAISHGSVEVVEFLLDKGAAIVDIDSNGSNVVDYVAANAASDPAMVQLVKERYREMCLDWWTAAGPAPTPGGV
jgi:ankyrin repeat protein